MERVLFWWQKVLLQCTLRQLLPNIRLMISVDLDEGVQMGDAGGAFVAQGQG
jgi:hypothetical protein